MTNNGICIVNFGSQYTQLIARRVRDLGVFSEVIHYSIAVKAIKEKKYLGIILSGSPSSIYDKNAPLIDKQIFELGLPVLGVCYGMQLLCHYFGAKIEGGETKEFGRSSLFIQNEKSKLFDKIPIHSKIWASHGDEVKTIPSGFEVTALSYDKKIIAGIENEKQKIYGVQFHPEVTHTECGALLLKNFLFKICNCIADWKTATFIAEAIIKIKNEVGDNKVILGLSGGVDSSVAAVLLNKAIGKNLFCIFVDTGLLRMNEADKVEEVYAKHFNINVKKIDASKKFLNALKGVDDPEQKRKIIGRIFVEVFQAEAKKIKKISFLAQGTIYPDVIESSSAGNVSHTIKSHHNVGGLPENLNLKIIEPLRTLFKDEVKKVGLKLGLTKSVLYRHPFPGPGLGVRILGKIDKQKIDILKQADHIFITELEKANLYHKVNQAFVVLLPVKSVGVMGDERTYEYTAVIRSVNTRDFMTATWSKLPYNFLENVSNKITNSVKGINRVVFDISSKPPSTIEWE